MPLIRPLLMLVVVLPMLMMGLPLLKCSCILTGVRQQPSLCRCTLYESRVACVMLQWMPMQMQVWTRAELAMPTHMPGLRSVNARASAAQAEWRTWMHLWPCDGTQQLGPLLRAYWV